MNPSGPMRLIARHAVPVRHDLGVDDVDHVPARGPGGGAEDGAGLLDLVMRHQPGASPLAASPLAASRLRRRVAAALRDASRSASAPLVAADLRPHCRRPSGPFVAAAFRAVSLRSSGLLA